MVVCVRRTVLIHDSFSVDVDSGLWQAAMCFPSRARLLFTQSATRFVCSLELLNMEFFEHSPRSLFPSLTIPKLTSPPHKSPHATSHTPMSTPSNNHTNSTVSS